MNQADTTPHQPDILNSEQAMEYLQVCRNTFYKLMHAGAIPHTKLGGQLRFSRRQILAMIEAGDTRDTTREPTAELPQGDRLGPAIARAKHAASRPADQVPPPKARRGNGQFSKVEQAKAKATAADALRKGHTRATAAKLAGVAPQTVKYWLTHDPEFLVATQAQPELF